MSLPTRRRLTTAAKVAALLAALGVAGYLVFQFAVGAQEGPSRPGNLLASNRTHLSLCVDAAGGGTVGPPEVERVSAALTRAFDILQQIPPEFGQPSVERGCPTPIPLTGQRFDFYDLCCELYNGFTDPGLLSPHRLLIYFLPDEVFQSSFGDAFGDERPFARVAAERLCYGDTCSEMTVSVYARGSVTEDALAKGLLHGLGLLPRTPEPTLDFQGCEQGTPQPGCDRYLDCRTAPPSDPDCLDFWREFGVEPPQ